MIVESPAKAKTIEKILGSDFEVRSCYGHIRDLEKDGMGIDLANGYRPHYIIPDEKLKVVGELRSHAKKAKEVWLASDEDREGESISWHLAEVLGLDVRSTKRIVFHEITAPAIKKAVANPRYINMDLVDAQQARRVLDRLVGFELSPVLWKKVQPSLSAGRVQSVAVRLIVDREREITHFVPASSYKVEAKFQAQDINARNVIFKAEGNDKHQSQQSARAFLESCVGASYKVASVDVRPTKRSPAPPFTTSTLQQEASRKLGYGVSKTMLLAQKLYESGLITYMRTDSFNLSDTAMADIGKEIDSHFGARYNHPRRFKNKNDSAQEAHEAIRPTYMRNHTIDDGEAKRLYELIWKRTIASQMSEAQFEKTTARIDIITNKEQLVATGEVMKFDGFLKVYLEGKDDEDEESETAILPPLSVGQSLAFQGMNATEKFTRANARYTEAALVKKMEELGIGRPSTYAPTITTIIKRNYVEKKDKEGAQRQYNQLTLGIDGTVSHKVLSENTGAEKGKLFPTDLGMVVTDFLNQHFQKVMDFRFTAKIEEEFDEIALGKIRWSNMIDGFYKPFHLNIENTLETAERAKGERVLGADPASGKKIVARMGKYGPMVQIGETTDEEKPRFAKLKTGQSIETIGLEEALSLFQLPKSIGELDGEELIIGVGRFGPYVKYKDTFISLDKGEEPLEVTLDRAVELVQARLKADAAIGVYEGKPVTKGKGRFGPFIKWDDLFINITKGYDYDRLSQSDIEELISKKIEKEANRVIVAWAAEKIAIENGRWGPFIKFGKENLKLPTKPEGGKYLTEEAALLTLEEVKAMIKAQMPSAFDPKPAGTKKMPSTKPLSAAAKKAATPRVKK